MLLADKDKREYVAILLNVNLSIDNKESLDDHLILILEVEFVRRGSQEKTRGGSSLLGNANC
jgi:hypothetical protein